MRALISDRVDDVLIRRLREAGVEVDYKPGIPREDLLRIVENYEILVVRSRTRVDREVIDRGARLRIVARAGVGLDNVDVDYAVRRGITIVSAPNAPAQSVAELTIGLVIAVARHIPQHVAEVKAGRWSKGVYHGLELEGKTMGVIGLGRIGYRVARLARGIGLNVVAYDVVDVNDKASVLGIDVAGSLEELLARSDVVSLHVPLMPETYRMLNEDRLRLVKDGAILVNTARGELIDVEALLRHVDRFWGVALDVLPEEPPRSEPVIKLVQHPKVIVTPHIGSETIEAQRRVAVETAENILEAIRRIEAPPAR